MSHDELTTQEQDQADEALIQKALANDPDALDALEFNRELEPGEKADDAIDYEDISDDDLAEDEDEGQEQTDTTNAQQGEQVPFEHDAPGDFSADLDDLFGEGPPTSPAAEVNNTSQDISFDFDDNLFGDSSVPFDNSSAQPADQAITTRPVESSHAQVGETLAVEDGSDAFLRQKQLFDDAKKKVDRVNGTQADQTLPAPPGNIEQLLERSWPKFERNTVPYWVDLFPQKRRKYAGKSLLKTPKPVNPTKISLEIAQDQEKHFRFSTVPNRRIDESSDQLGYIAIRDLESSEKSTDDEMDIESDYENEPIGGITWQDFQVVCEDWDIESIPQSPSPMLEPQVYEDPDDIFGDLDVDAGRPSPKVSLSRKLPNC